MSYTFDKFMTRIVNDEAHRRTKQSSDSELLTEEKIREIDPNRQLIAGREHWQNRTRLTRERK